MAQGVRTTRLVAGWLVGMALISWRYLWQTTPLHRDEERTLEGSCHVPELAEHLLDQQCQPNGHGVGELYHRLFSVRIEGGVRDPEQVMAEVKRDLNRAAPTEVATFRKTRGEQDSMRPGHEFVVRMPGPWNGPVRVVDCADEHFRFVTLRGHLEAGQIEFRARQEDTALRFEIETWAQPSSVLVNLLYARLRLAKEMQLNMWMRYCLGVADSAGGQPAGGISINTWRVVRAPSRERPAPVRGRDPLSS